MMNWTRIVRCVLIAVVLGGAGIAYYLRLALYEDSYQNGFIRAPVDQSPLRQWVDGFASPFNVFIHPGSWLSFFWRSAGRPSVNSPAAGKPVSANPTGGPFSAPLSPASDVENRIKTAEDFLVAGSTEQADAALERALAAVRSSTPVGANWFAVLAGLYAREGNDFRARDMVTAASEVGRYFESDALFRIALAHAKAGRKEKAQEFTRQALQSVANGGDISALDLLFSAVDEYKKIGGGDMVSEMLPVALASARTTSVNMREPYLTRIAAEYDELGELAKARRSGFYCLAVTLNSPLKIELANHAGQSAVVEYNSQAKDQGLHAMTTRLPECIAEDEGEGPASCSPTTSENFLPLPGGDYDLTIFSVDDSSYSFQMDGYAMAGGWRQGWLVQGTAKARESAKAQIRVNAQTKDMVVQNGQITVTEAAVSMSDERALKFCFLASL